MCRRWTSSANSRSRSATAGEMLRCAMLPIAVRRCILTRNVAFALVFRDKGDGGVSAETATETQSEAYRWHVSSELVGSPDDHNLLVCAQLHTRLPLPLTLAHGRVPCKHTRKHTHARTRQTQTRVHARVRTQTDARAHARRSCCALV